MADEENETLEAPAKEGYEAFVGVDPEYRDPNRNAKLTTADVKEMTDHGFRTDAARVRAINNNTVLSFAEAQGINVVLVEVDEEDKDEAEEAKSETPVESKDENPLSAPIL